MSNMKEPFTYSSLTGKRKLRRYIWSALFIAGALLVIFGYSMTRRASARAEVMATPRPLVTQELVVVQVTSTPEPLPTPTSEPTTEPCPTDPDDWTLVDTFPGDNYKRIEPHCVYDDLGRTVAWTMLLNMGYTMPEATEMLGFETEPWAPIWEIKGLTNLKGPQMINISMRPGPHPDYRVWIVDRDGSYRMTFGLRGCYRARDIVGSDVRYWHDFPVICVVAADRHAGSAIHTVGEIAFGSHHADGQHARTFEIYGYDPGAHLWLSIGSLTGHHVLFDDWQGFAEEREATAVALKAPVWDGSWLVETYDFRLFPLPELWRTIGFDPNMVDEMGVALEPYFPDKNGRRDQ